MKLTQRNHYTWQVENDEATKVYEVVHRKDGSWFCDCAFYRFQGGNCKHINLVKADFVIQVI